jgi:hypothetical protein
MNALAEIVLDIVERAKRANRKTRENPTESNVTRRGMGSAALAICARTQSNVEARAEELRQAGARVIAVAASLTDEAQVR